MAIQRRHLQQEFKAGVGREAMFLRIMVPVDLAHIPRLHKALEVAGSCAKAFDVPGPMSV
jgi:hypothetical protein